MGISGGNINGRYMENGLSSSEVMLKCENSGKEES
jgi:hypothetical protein